MPLFIIVLSLFSAAGSFSQVKDDDVKKAFENGDAKKLQQHFSERITLNITGTEVEVSAYEATELVEDFFTNHNVKNFRVKFEGEKSHSKFMIATLYTEKATFRVNIFFKKIRGEDKIHNLRIEEENEAEF
jgi:hypothetical protein